MNSENAEENLKAIQAKIAELEKQRDGLQAQDDVKMAEYQESLRQRSFITRSLFTPPPPPLANPQLTTVEKKLAELKSERSELKNDRNTQQIVLATQQNVLATQQNVQATHEVRAVLSKEEDYSGAWFYSTTLRDYSVMKTPFEQYTFHLTLLSSTYGVCSYAYRRHHLYEIEKYPTESTQWWKHVGAARVYPDEKAIKAAVITANSNRFGWVLNFIYPVAWTWLVWVKNSYLKSKNNGKPKSISKD